MRLALQPSCSDMLKKTGRLLKQNHDGLSAGSAGHGPRGNVLAAWSESNHRTALPNPHLEHPSAILASTFCPSKMPSTHTASAYQRTDASTHSDDPPPYQLPSTSSINHLGMTTSTPLYQFLEQVRREMQRLEYRIRVSRQVREHFPLADRTKSFQANAEYIVRARWIHQGIWEDGWDVSRSEGEREWLSPRVSGLWAHERPAVLPRHHTPEPESKPQTFGLFGRAAASEEPAKASMIPGTIAVQARTARNPEASRPRPQFLYQVSQEREWLKFKIFHTMRTLEDFNLDILAYCSVKRFWQESFIWDKDWHDLPGDTWMHESTQNIREILTPPPETPTPLHEDVTRMDYAPLLTRRTGLPQLRRSARIAARGVRRPAGDVPEGEEKRPLKRLRRT